jgi:hypothetical protein
MMQRRRTLAQCYTIAGGAAAADLLTVVIHDANLDDLSMLSNRENGIGPTPAGASAPKLHSVGSAIRRYRTERQYLHGRLA